MLKTKTSEVAIEVCQAQFKLIVVEYNGFCRVKKELSPLPENIMAQFFSCIFLSASNFYR